MESEVNSPTQRDLRRPSRLWMLYFLASIASIGFFVAYVLVIPLCLVGRLIRPLWRTGGKILVHGVDLLMRVQPWYRAKVDLNLPPLSENGPAFITVSNHRSHLDMFVLLSHIPNIRAVTKSALFHVPFLAVMLRVMKMIPVKRGNSTSYMEAIDTARRAYLAGDPVHVFPEMTRCDEGLHGTNEFQLLPFHMAHQQRAPIVPIVFVGTDRTWAKGFFGIRPYVPIVVKSLPPVDSGSFPSATHLRDEVRRQIDGELRRYGY